MEEVTLDTGALIALERRKPRAIVLVAEARRRGTLLLVPMPVIAEWWRGRTDRREDLLAALTVEEVSLRVAQAAGEALAGIEHRGPSVIDALVMAHAAHRGGVVYTSDPDDLGQLRDARFPSVRVLAI